MNHIEYQARKPQCDKKIEKRAPNHPYNNHKPASLTSRPATRETLKAAFDSAPHNQTRWLRVCPGESKRPQRAPPETLPDIEQPLLGAINKTHLSGDRIQDKFVEHVLSWS